MSETAVKQIKSLRAASNAAIAAHDVAGVMANVAEDVIVTVGSGEKIRGRDQYAAAFSDQFAAMPDTLYVRTPQSIKVSRPTSSLVQAFEVGRWTGSWQDGAEPVTCGGHYGAGWRLTSTGWEVHSELFVTLWD